MADSDSMQPSSKRRCFSGEEKEKEKEIDRISDLPDALLCHILSFLPTEESVATSILSKRWEDLWTQVPTFNFYDFNRFHTTCISQAARFINFVNNVCLNSKAESIRNFTLDLYSFYPKSNDHRVLSEWIHSAVIRNVEEFSLHIRHSKPITKLPSCVFYCKTLVSLELKGAILIDVPTMVFLPCLSILQPKGLKYANDVPAMVYLPCLRILQLKGVKYANDNTLRSFISGCPVLEDLTIEGNCYSHDNIIAHDINVPSLKRITATRYNLGPNNHNLLTMITAPMLERIDLNDVFWDFDASNLAEASIEVCFEKCSNEQQLLNLLKKMANVRFLSLLKFTIWPVRQPSKAKFPMFQNLVHLDIGCTCQKWHTLLALLECSDNLKILEIRSTKSHFGDSCDQALERMSVPKCVSMSLKTLILRGVYNRHCELKLLRYVLKNAELLKQMKIGLCSKSCTTYWRRGLDIKWFLYPSESLIREKMLNYPRASMAFDISFFQHL